MRYYYLVTWAVNLYIEQQVTSSWPSVFLLCGLLFLAVLLQTLLRGPQTVHMSQAAGPPSCVTDLREVTVDTQNWHTSDLLDNLGRPVRPVVETGQTGQDKFVIL